VSAQPFQIRGATVRDTDQLCELGGELLADIHADVAITDLKRFFQHIMNSGDRRFVVVAESEGTLCGYAYASYEWRAEFCGETMDIVALFVSAQWRNKGVGRSLIASLLQNARQRGIRLIRAEVHPGNSSFERTLESSGFDLERRTLWGLWL
jgi:GNAT superfamily N-acetyltransferase